MTDNNDIILKLMKNALWRFDIKNITECNWNEIDDIVQKHAIGSIMASIDQAVFIPKIIKDKWIATAAYQIVYNHRLLADQDLMLKILTDANIPVVILKGSASSQYYPHPEFRPMGDIDFIVPREKYEEAYKVLSSNDFVLMHERTETERHLEMKHNGFIYELHRFYTVSNDTKYAQQLDDLILSNIENRIWIDYEGHSIPVLPPLINGLVLLQHINHHMERGLGLRQIIDWMMFFSKEIVSAAIWEKFHKYVDLVGLEKLEYYITSMCIYYFGLKSPKDVYDADKKECKDLLQYILSSGNFGQGQELTEKKVATVLRRSRSPLQWIRMMCRNGNIHWREVHKHDLLPPFAFGYQIIYYIKAMFTQGISVRKIGSLAKQHKREHELFEKMGVRVFAKGSTVYKDGKYEKNRH